MENQECVAQSSYQPPLDAPVIVDKPSNTPFIGENVTFHDDETGELIFANIDLRGIDLKRLDEIAKIFSSAIEICTRLGEVLDKDGKLISQKVS